MVNNNLIEQNNDHNNVKKSGKALGIISMIFGIISLIIPLGGCTCSCLGTFFATFVSFIVGYLSGIVPFVFVIISLIFAIAALILAIIGKKKSKKFGMKNTMATIGLITSIFGLVISVALLVYLIICTVLGIGYTGLIFIYSFLKTLGSYSGSAPDVYYY